MVQKRLVIAFLTVLSFTTLMVPAQGTASPRTQSKKPPGTVQARKAPVGDPAAGQINSRSAVLVEVSTGTTLLEQEPDLVIEPASFTKVLTLYLVFEAIHQGLVKMSDEVYISETAWRTGGSKMFVELGTRVPLEDLLKGITVVSGNDACVAVAEHLYGSVEGFVHAMNRKARQLGMTQSTFLNPHGLPVEGQVTTARDMAILCVSYLQRFPESLRFHSMKEFTYNNIVQYNRNHLLLKDPSVDGLKTGYVAAAGYHLAATAQRDGTRLLAVVMGAATPGIREREALRLLNYGFRQFVLIQPFPNDKPVTTLKVWKGTKDQLDLYPQGTAAFLIAQAQKSALRWEVEAPKEVTAPVKTDQPMGELVFYVADQPMRRVPLVSREDIQRAGWFKSAWQSILMVPTLDWKVVTGILASISFLGLVVLFVVGRRSSSKRPRSSASR
ncbi:MAG: D-alanyl-D-alanine carboxypeptidase [Syntrophobacteraceae bacterium]|nr:D-alanyl-D-alanine carboxypeptidase [Syntrophobacteraceae bacterium]